MEKDKKNNELKCPHCRYKITESVKSLKINRILICKFPECGKKFLVIKQPKYFYNLY